jgi:hypothetical protein
MFILKDAKIGDHDIILQLWRLSTLSIVLPLFKTQRFGDWIMSLSSGPELGARCIEWAHLSTFYLKTEIESSLLNVGQCPETQQLYSSVQMLWGDQFNSCRRRKLQFTSNFLPPPRPE